MTILLLKPLQIKPGARALRAILEEFMLDIMFEIPKDDNIGRVTITGDYIAGKGAPIIEIRSKAHHKDNIENKETTEEVLPSN